MKLNIMVGWKKWIQNLLVIGIFYVISSVLYTLFSTLYTRNRFPLLAKLFYFPNYWEVLNEVSATEPPKQSLVFQKPRILEENKVIEFPAVVEPTKEIQLHNKQSGRIRKIYVEEGSIVKEGQILLEIDDELLRLESERLRLSAQVSESNAAIALEKWKLAEKQVDVKLREIDKKTEWIELAEKEWNISKDLKEKKIILWKQGFVSLSEIEKLKQEEQSKETQYKNLIRDRENLLSGMNLELDTEDLGFEERLKIWRKKNTSLEKSEYELAQSHLKIIKNQIKSNEQLLSETKLRAPKSGKILKIQIKEGELTTQSPVMLLMEKGELSAGFQIGESDLSYFTPGKEILFLPSLDQLPAIRGKLDQVGGFLDPRSHSIGIKVKLEIKNNDILPGMFGLVQVKLPDTIEKVIIPLSSLHGNETSGFYVNAKGKEGEITKRYIQFKPYLLNELEILSGLSSEDEVETSLAL
ncbi:biotin/lipoyl-binding protein [Leptospira sp. 2 VSF19]|uniref:Biotin/lipoyl-binding protein n=1 Tax=Leptospira soteropolitanensis TaxID=2950025 RepID=A0AAW5VI07_9LEPT|nr:biotin/lipoyl-binding protein [Leptospira soteropolitanensis]MCW7493883.1 biotin/lipoyl-binding protein [Leptospira soteropolitanensis]MCW7501477.1 biotin/lipoyl-binding protein [Leptospira soteropolitanensis]MCW7523760.1 biotin/lipoyl-binding protein [Leptospira soteropolitanensis]MCW7527624.1 biotin/lipoyl-binding protein [Leptospira soteropolitanensis]MCW7531478.1 biotin/lipoyl-binding protein [Leptospira soteropolitanensis]